MSLYYDYALDVVVEDSYEGSDGFMEECKEILVGYANDTKDTSKKNINKRGIWVRVEVEVNMKMI